MCKCCRYLLVLNSLNNYDFSKQFQSIYFDKIYMIYYIAFLFCTSSYHQVSLFIIQNKLINKFSDFNKSIEINKEATSRHKQNTSTLT